jgi:DNA-binding CsgD family transcriptional regulator
MEIRVADLIQQGSSSKEIAALLGLSIRTIESHRKNIRAKLGLANKKENLRGFLQSLETNQHINGFESSLTK